MQIPRRKGLKTFLRRYFPFEAASSVNLTFKKAFLCKNFSHIAHIAAVGIFLFHPRDQEHGTGTHVFAIHAKRLPQQAFDSVPLYAFSELFSHADRHFQLFVFEIDDRKRVGISAFSVFQNFFKLFFCLDGAISPSRCRSLKW